ncbi:MAG TPA: hypothetical protein VFH58_06795 [Acidimicrobiales bacterium]|nr:hypothetical protein [Acidimicrobiales bacterium]
MPRSQAPDAGEGWVQSAEWLPRARRLGPLRYSDLGSRRLGAPAADAEELRRLAGWIAQAADGWWEAAGRPDPFTLVVASGDDGRLAQAVLAEQPACRAALRYVLVDPDHAGRREPPPAMAAMVRLEEPAFLYPAAPPGPSGRSGPSTPAASAPMRPEIDMEELDLEFGERPPARGIGPLATFLTEVPALGEAEGAVVAVRLLSRLPYDLYELRAGKWCEIRLAAEGDRLVEMAVPAGDLPHSADPTALTTPGGPTPPAAPTPPNAATPSAAPTPPAAPTPTAPAGHAPPTPPRRRRLTGAGEWLRRILPTAAGGALAVIDDWAPPGDTETLDLAQLRQVREPHISEPAAIDGTSLSAVTWRLG